MFPRVFNIKILLLFLVFWHPSHILLLWRFVLCVLYRRLCSIDGRMTNWQGFEETRSNSVELICLNFLGLRKTMEIQLDGTMIKIQTRYLQNTSIEDQRNHLFASSSPVRYSLN
jgi:hypothetical protein